MYRRPIRMRWGLIKKLSGAAARTGGLMKIK